MEKHGAYLDFIRYTLADSATLPTSSGNINWMSFLDFCYRQSIQGVVFGGIERAELTIPQDVLFEWISMAEMTKHTNATLNRQCVELTAFFKKNGYCSCILKGQANAMLYPRPELRSPGDIDIWVAKESRGKKDKERNDTSEDAAEIIRMVQEKCPDAHYGYHHVKFPIYQDTSVEVHYMPSVLNNWKYNAGVQKFEASQKERQLQNRVKLDGAEIGVLTDDFNVVFLMLHMYKHYFSSRNNLKQMMDYYYLLKRDDVRNMKEYVEEQFRRFGIMRYARGVMWVMKEVLGLEKKYLIVEPDEEFGRVLLSDTLNYGLEGEYGKIGILFGRIKDNLHLMRFFPVDVMIGPLYLLWHQWWKFNMKQKLSK